MDKETINQTGILEMGWTKTLIKKYLPEPMLECNPMYKKAPPMKLWYVSDVKQAMLKSSFQEDLEKSKKRRASSCKAVETKKKKLEKEIVDFLNQITVTVISDSDLEKQTLIAKQEWYNQCAFWYGDLPRDINNVDEDTLCRWKVNYIRHNLVTYDDELQNMRGKTGCHTEYPKFKNAILDKIAEAYPNLKEECENQKVDTLKK